MIKQTHLTVPFESSKPEIRIGKNLFRSQPRISHSLIFLTKPSRSKTKSSVFLLISSIHRKMSKRPLLSQLLSSKKTTREPLSLAFQKVQKSDPHFALISRLRSVPFWAINLQSLISDFFLLSSTKFDFFASCDYN